MRNVKRYATSDNNRRRLLKISASVPGRSGYLGRLRRVGENVGVFSGRPEFVQDTASKFGNFLYSK